MEVRYDYIFVKPSDFKVCKECNRINWYKNDHCIECGSEKFDNEERKVREAIEREYDFYEQEEGYTEEEIDAILTEV